MLTFDFMRVTGKKPATYQDLLALPNGKVGQLIGGELIASPRPSSNHTLASSVLGDELLGPFQRGKGGPGGWWILDEPELHLGNDVVVPDLVGWRRARMPSLPKAAPFFTLPPDWVCEVLSPSTAGLDRVRKKHIYAREQVEYVWLVDPLARTLEVYRLEGGRWVERGTFEGDARVRAEPFEAIELELNALWIEGDEPDEGSPT